MRTINLIYLFFFSFFIGSAQTLTVDEYTKKLKPIGFVNDYAQLFTEEQQNQLEQQLSLENKQTSIQYVLCTVDSLNNLSVKDLAVSLGNHWGVGQKKIDNGVLMLIAKKEQQLFIATGKGTEKYLSNSKLEGIINQTILPKFKQDELFDGTQAGLLKIKKELKGTPLIKTPKERAKKKTMNSLAYAIPIALILGILTFLLPRLFRKKKKRKGFFGGGSFKNGGGAGGSW